VRIAEATLPGRRQRAGGDLALVLPDRIGLAGDSRLRQGEIEGSALARGRLRPDAAAVLGDDPVDNGEADAGPRKFADVVHALKGLEQPRGIGHVEAGAVVADEIHGLTAADLTAEFDFRRLPSAGELPGITEEVVERDAHETGIG